MFLNSPNAGLRPMQLKFSPKQMVFHPASLTPTTMQVSPQQYFLPMMHPLAMWRPTAAMTTPQTTELSKHSHNHPNNISTPLAPITLKTKPNDHQTNKICEMSSVQASVAEPSRIENRKVTVDQKRIFRPWLDDPEVKESKSEPSITPQSPDLSIKSVKSPKLQIDSHKSGASKRVIVTDDAQSRQASAMELVATNLGKTIMGHRCIYCGKIYSRKYGLKIHLRTHTGFKPLKCAVCRRPFGDPSNLNKHTRLHAEQYNADDNNQLVQTAPQANLAAHGMLSCALCGKTVLKRKELESHLMSRHGFDLRKVNVKNDQI